MMKAAYIATLALPLALAGPFSKRVAESATATVGGPLAGATSSDVYPPPGATVNTKLFPSEPVIGYPGVTMTGVEPAAIQTAAAYAYNDGKTQNFPLVVDQPSDDTNGTFDIYKTWGNLAPWYSVPSSAYGLNNATPLTPESCSITQVHLLYRHGARYPTSGALPSVFSAKLQNATKTTGFSASGSLAFLNTWKYKLGAELLTPFGRLQNFELGVEMRQHYGYLLNNFTTQGVLPVFRTESQDRMVKTAQNFAAGFFGVPEFLDQVNIEIAVEAAGFNITGAPYETCTNSNVASRGSIGSTAATAFATKAFNTTISRFQGQIKNVTIGINDVLAMLQLCSYETDALGYSQFCKLFTVEEFKNYEYYYDLSFYYNNGPGSPVSAAQGLGYLQEFVSRFEETPLNVWNSTTNSTLDGNNVTFPLKQSIYADATHEVVVLDTLSAFNLSGLWGNTPLPTGARPANQTFVASQVVPFGTHFLVQVMECSKMTPTKQMRFIVNDAVVPISDSYPGCAPNVNGLCAFDTVVPILKKRMDEIDYQYDCFGNYTATSGINYNGRAPRS